MAEAQPDTAPTTDQWPVLPRDTDIAVKCAPLQGVVNKSQELLLALYPPEAFEDGKLKKDVKLIITDEAIASKATDLVAHCTKALRTIDTRRIAYTEPARTFTTNLNNEVKLYTNPVEKVKADASAALLAFAQKKRDDAAEAERQAREKREADALEQAQTLQAQGNSVAAERVLDVAASAPARRSALRPTETRGETTGRKAAIRTTWVGSIANFNAILQAVIDGKLSREGIEIGQAWMNKVATGHQKEEVIYGIQVTKKEGLG